ncbi:glycosyltransferase [Vibrio alginolyticus]|uniref:glycosyltransferase n=1 Tax=Vibrio sp. Vb1729 TaxID=3074644 RepID=UPI002965210C|nr:glycosyltransferase [Vibrio sp. Vb1729]EGQ9111193.1 glycosyltransferase [Vibrio alginolyticus]EJL6749806.1 glycosyltransferase [Vibrio alginolyticus]EMA9138556.1 glycosyltransferase [Vibrio alginolyticus]MDW1896655.1 glycosyltransferase [Vibrio sp. Vb1729]
MSKVLMIGSFTGVNGQLGGQITKSKFFFDLLKRTNFFTKVRKVDCSASKVKVLASLLMYIPVSDRVFIGLGRNGMPTLGLLSLVWCKIFRKNVSYLVIGGWLGEILKNKPFLRWAYSNFDGILVETISLKNQLNELGLNNITVFSNYRDSGDYIPIEKKNINFDNPIKTIYFSRVNSDKGIYRAIDAVQKYNKKFPGSIYLDVYGPLEGIEEEHIKSDMVTYKGVVDGTKVNVYELLECYDCMLFPTKHEGEGFPGVVVESFISGVPVIASDWKYNSEIISNGVNGLIFSLHDKDGLYRSICQLFSDEKYYNNLRKIAILSGEKFKVEEAERVLNNYLVG